MRLKAFHPFQCDPRFNLIALPFLLIDPQRGERILDMCAAPGGKTTAIASIMKDEGEVVAVDRSHNKVLFLTGVLNCSKLL